MSNLCGPIMPVATIVGVVVLRSQKIPRLNEYDGDDKDFDDLNLYTHVERQLVGRTTKREPHSPNHHLSRTRIQLCLRIIHELHYDSSGGIKSSGLLLTAVDFSSRVEVSLPPWFP